MDILLVPKYGILGASLATGSAGLLQFFFYWIAFKWYVKLNIIFPWKALGKTLVNIIPVFILFFFSKPYITSVFILILFIILAATLYLCFAYVNKVFSVQERLLFNRAIGRNLFVF